MRAVTIAYIYYEQYSAPLILHCHADSSRLQLSDRSSEGGRMPRDSYLIFDIGARLFAGPSDDIGQLQAFRTGGRLSEHLLHRP